MTGFDWLDELLGFTPPRFHWKGEPMAVARGETRTPSQIDRARKVEHQDQFTHALVRFKDPANWTPQGRREIANWLREQADKLEAIGAQYSRNFTARYLS